MTEAVPVTTPAEAPPPTTNAELAAECVRLDALVTALTRRIAEVEKASRLFATNRELDAPKGDPIVKFDPRAWKGPSYKEKRFSECPATYLDLLADYLAWAAENPKDGKTDFVSINRHQARLARSWARRLRAREADKAAAAPADDREIAPRAPGAGRPRVGGRPSVPRRAVARGTDKHVDGVDDTPPDDGLPDLDL
jgi:hypothetical protein